MPTGYEVQMYHHIAAMAKASRDIQTSLAIIAQELKVANVMRMATLTAEEQLAARRISENSHSGEEALGV